MTFESQQKNWGNLLDGEIWSAILNCSVESILLFQVWDHLFPGIWILVAVTVIAVASALRRRVPRLGLPDMGLLWMIIGAWIVYAISNKATGSADPVQFRYFYVQQIAFLLFLARAGEPFFNGTPQQKLRRRFILCIGIALAVATTLSLHTLPGFRVRRDPASKVLLEEIHAAERRILAGHHDSFSIQSTNQQFPFTVTVRKK